MSNPNQPQPPDEPHAATASQLAKQGIEKMRLPNWNEHAYLEVPPDGPWCNLYDVLAGIGGGEPIPMLLADADRHNNWVPVEGGSVR